MENKTVPQIINNTSIDSDGVCLDALINQHQNRESLPLNSIGIVLTHPLPLFGGDMQNNVVSDVAYALAEKGALTLRFNFRGVGKSGGSTSWFGDTERTDVINVCKYLVEEHGIKKIILVGYSYGSVISSSVADEVSEVIGFAAISYPFGVVSLLLLGHLVKFASESKKPKFFIMGAEDNFTGSSSFRSHMSQFENAPTSVIINSMDHFWANSKPLISSLNEWIKTLTTDQQ